MNEDSKYEKSQAVIGGCLVECFKCKECGTSLVNEELMKQHIVNHVAINKADAEKKTKAEILDKIRKGKA